MTAQLPASDLPDAHLPQPGDVVGGKYRVDSFIARGGMGAVLAATHQITGRRLALKWVLTSAEHDAESTYRLLREARAAARVRHPNVVDVYDVGEHEGSLFLVMELLEGETLHDKLKAGGALDPRTTLGLLLPALRAVEAAHACQVVHRDLKPSNIYLSRGAAADEITPRVLDFGISKILAAGGDGERSVTRTGAVIGTPHYMSPEQLTGAEPDARADIYALGVILYQCLTGRLPFSEANYNALVLQIATGTPVPIAALAPRVPAGLIAVVMRAMARAPADRFESVSDLIGALQPWSTELASAPRMPAHVSSKTKRVWMILTACVLAAVAVWLTWEQSESNGLAAPEPPAVDRAQTPATPIAAPAPAPVLTPAFDPAPAAAAAPALEPEPQPRRDRARRRQRPAEEPAVSAPEPPSGPATKQPVSISHEQF
jgi:serine/threonine-protein kinase